MTNTTNSFLCVAVLLLTLSSMPAWSATVSHVSLTAESYTAESHAAENYTSDLGNVAAQLKSENPQTIPPSRSTVSAEALRQRQFLASAQSAQAQSSATTVAPPVSGCADVTIGSAYSASTAASGSTDCFEFIAPDQTKIVADVVNLPASEEHDVHLVRVNPDSSLAYLDTEADTSPDKIVEATPGGSTRLLLLVDSQQGSGGATFQFEVFGSTGYDKYEPNDSPLEPTKLSGDQQINANLDTVSDYDYYTVKVPATQTSNLITFTGSGTQTAELETAPNTWATLASRSEYPVTTSAGATLMLRVYNTGTSAPAAQTYSLRVSDHAGIAGIYQFLDKENITHLVPNEENVARTIMVGVKAYDHTGNVRLPPGEHVIIQAYDRDSAGNPTLLTTTSGYTTVSGDLVTPLNIGDCEGPGTLTRQFHTISVPTDYWQITYNPNSYAVAYLDGNSQAQHPRSSYAYFIHICKETYLGQ